jgi:hypothetical protein
MTMKLFVALWVLGISGQVWGAGPQKKDDKDDNLYSSFGKRDPFKVPSRGGLTSGPDSSDPLRKYRLEGYRLRAIMRIAGKPQAMFEDPDGHSHVVSEGDRMGMEGAHISRIINSEVIVTERSTNYLGKETLLEKVISLPAGEGEREAGGVVQQSFNGLPAAVPGAGAPSPTPPVIIPPSAQAVIDPGPAPASLPKQ